MQKDSSLVSVIMPAFNAEKYIEEAINSVISQTYSNWELIITDDGSADNTALIIKKFIESDSRIYYLYQNNSGQGKARNAAIKKASGRYIAFLDADDWWMPEKLSIQVAIMLNNKIDLTFSDAFIFHDTSLPEKKMGVKPGYYQGEEAVLDFLFCNHIPMLTVLVLKKAIDDIGVFSENREITEDYHLWIRMLIGGNSFLGNDLALAHYRVNQLSSSSGEAKLLFLTLGCLNEIGNEWAQYKATVSVSMLQKINHHLAKVNISKWSIAHRLLRLRNNVSADNLSILYWKGIYCILGKRFFRKLFSALTKSTIKISKPGDRDYLFIPCF